jgi:hypothetical protein
MVLCLVKYRDNFTFYYKDFKISKQFSEVFHSGRLANFQFSWQNTYLLSACKYSF